MRLLERPLPLNLNLATRQPGWQFIELSYCSDDTTLNAEIQERVTHGVRVRVQINSGFDRNSRNLIGKVFLYCHLQSLPIAPALASWNSSAANLTAKPKGCLPESNANMALNIPAIQRKPFTYRDLKTKSELYNFGAPFAVGIGGKCRFSACDSRCRPVLGVK